MKIDKGCYCPYCDNIFLLWQRILCRILLSFFAAYCICLAGCTSECNYSIYESESVWASGGDNQYTVKYAQISGLNSKQQEENINSLLKDAVFSWLTANTEWVSECQIRVMYQSPEYLSICYEWAAEDPSSDVENGCIRICITINIKEQTRIYLTDIIDADILKNYLTNYSYDTEFSPPIDSDEAQRIISYASMSEYDYLQEMAKQDNLASEFTKSYMSAKPSFYMENNGITIIRDTYELNDISYSWNPD